MEGRQTHVNERLIFYAIAERWPHLQRIKEMIPELERKIEIGLLIRCNCPKPKETSGKSEEPHSARLVYSGPHQFL